MGRRGDAAPRRHSATAQALPEEWALFTCREWGRLPCARTETNGYLTDGDSIVSASEGEGGKTVVWLVEIFKFRIATWRCLSLPPCKRRFEFSVSFGAFLRAVHLVLGKLMVVRGALSGVPGIVTEESSEG